MVAGTEQTDWIINPRKQLFPWLKIIASCYDMYRVNSMSFIYKPDCPTTVGGAIALYVDYDATDDNSTVPFDELYSMAGCVTDSIYKPLTLKVDKKSMANQQSWMYCAGGDSPELLKDVGRLWVRTRGPAEYLNAGRLFVSYSISLKDPEAPAKFFPQSLTSRIKDAEPATLASITANNPLGSSNSTVVEAQLLDTVVNHAPQLYNFAKNLCRSGGCTTTDSIPTGVASLPTVCNMIALTNAGAGSPMVEASPGDNYTFNTIDGDGNSYFVVFDPAEYVRVDASACGDATVTGPTATYFTSHHNDGWELVGDGGRFTSTPSALVNGVNHIVTSITSLFYHRKPGGSRSFIWRFSLWGGANFAFAGGSTTWSSTVPYTFVSITDCIPDNIVPV